MKKKKNKLPDFNKMTYREEATWWDTHDLGEYWDEFDDVNIIFDLKKPRDETVVVRMQKELKDKLLRFSQSRGINISTLIRMWAIEKLRTAR